MLIPRFWARAEGAATDREGRKLALRQWGWSQESVADALSLAGRRVAEVAARLTGGVTSHQYLYGSRQPLREEIVRYLGDDRERGYAVVTRNRYGALVLNTSRVPFIDVDVAAPPALEGLKRLFGRGPAVDPTLERIRDACGRHPRQAFRVYRTHSGYRVLATNTYLDPASDETQDFLRGFGADPDFAKLCRVQASFRARLTPKPWRCDVPAPPGQHPRDPATQQEFGAWLLKYETASRAHATCAFVEAIGSAPPDSDVRGIVDEHDRTRGRRRSSRWRRNREQGTGNREQGTTPDGRREPERALFAPALLESRVRTGWRVARAGARRARGCVYRADTRAPLRTVGCPVTGPAGCPFHSRFVAVGGPRVGVVSRRLQAE